MTWTHFTSYLDGSRFITQAERDELYTQLAVQLAACSATLTLNATDQAALTGSKLITGLASLDNSATATNTRGELHAILEAASGAWSNYASVVAAALTAEGLTTTTRGDILARLPDHHKLWNYYRRVIDGVTCSVPAPGLLCRTASASKTKCGYAEYGTPSSPPKRYLVRTLSGMVWAMQQVGAGCTGDCAEYAEETYSGTCSYSRPGCGSPTVAGNLNVKVWQPCDTLDSNADVAVCSVVSGFGGLAETLTLTTRTLSGVGCGGPFASDSKGGSATETLSSEYTTALLGGDVDAAIPSFSGSYGSYGCSAFYDLTTDELTATKRALQYKFTIPSGLTGCYKLTWVERFTPEGGGSPTDTAKSYLWDGTATETPAYTISAPAAQGTTTIADVVATFDCA